MTQPEGSRHNDPTGPLPSNLMRTVQASLGATYVIEGELGGGGMSRVFVAHEPGLGRRVVIKLLAPELAAEISTERFEREIRLAASLQQANIVPLLSAGRAGDLPYYTMPFVEGRSLRDRLIQETLLPIRDALSVLRDVARALGYAHDRGVVHRDIKPDNVLLSGGTAVVTDFGIAKALSAARADDSVSALTRTGVVIGTPAYMAPEQAAGESAVDHRADIYAFGCTAFEMFTGKPPFHGLPAHQMMAAHFRDVPPLVTTLRPEVPQAVAALVARCLEKNPDLRPQNANALLTTLDVTGEQVAAAGRPLRRMWIIAGVVVTALLIGAIGLSLRKSSIDAKTPTPTPSIGTTNPEALDQYRLGQVFFRQRGVGIKRSIEAFEHAIVLDPTFARAHAALASALALSPYFVGTPPAEVKDRVTSEAGRALDLDRTLGEAHDAMGDIDAETQQWDQSAREFERAIALQPDSLSTRVGYARMWIYRGDLGRARAQLDQARRIAPVSPLVSAWTGFALYLAGRDDSAFAEIGRAMQLDSTLLPLSNLGSLMSLARGNPAVARRLMKITAPVGAMSNAPYVYAKLGDTATAWRLVRAIEANDPRPWFAESARASVFLALGDTARALDNLERSDAVSGSTWVLFIVPRDHAYDPLRQSPRFAALIRKAGLDVKTFTQLCPRGCS